MDHDRGFLEAIQEFPDDDLHRLAWADWLEERGQDARATFIRHQLRLARLADDDPARAELEDEAEDLLAAHEPEWAGMLGMVAEEWQWRRGCIERVTIWGDTLLKQGVELLATMPIRELRLLADPDDLKNLAASPVLGRVERLDLGQPRDGSPFAGAYLLDAPVQALLRSPHLTRLVELDLSGQGIEGPAVQAMIDTGLLARLRGLDLSRNHAVGDRLVRLLAEAAAPRLVSLGLRGTNLTPAGLRAFLATNQYPALETLEVNLDMLFRRGLTPAGLERELLAVPLVKQLTGLVFEGMAFGHHSLAVLLAAFPAGQLRSLELRNCVCGEAEAQAIAGEPRLSGLRRLVLPDNSLRDKGLRALAESPHLARVTELNVRGNEVGGPGLKAMLGSPTFAALRRLDLSGNHVGSYGVEVLARGDEPRRLVFLHLGSCNLGVEAAEMLANSPALGRVRVLWLNGNRLSDEGVAALAKGKGLQRLQHLHLDSNHVDSPGAVALIESAGLGRVRQLSMRNAYITSNEREQLRARFGAGTQF